MAITMLAMTHRVHPKQQEARSNNLTQKFMYIVLSTYVSFVNKFCDLDVLLWDI